MISIISIMNIFVLIITTSQFTVMYSAILTCIHNCYHCEGELRMCFILVYKLALTLNDDILRL